MKIVASIEEPEVIAQILAHLERRAAEPSQIELSLGAPPPPGQERLL